MKELIKKISVKFESFTYAIEEDLPEIGWYLYRYDYNMGMTHDYLQDDLETAINNARDEFGVPEGLWQSID